ncbi:hypothetical protein [Terrihabitans soli]|nr:hypothetical protein [Terrihabitans soli]
MGIAVVAVVLLATSAAAKENYEVQLDRETVVSYRQQISDYILENFHDPESVQDVVVSLPYRPLNSAYPDSTAICLQFRARVPAGGLMLSNYIGYFKNDKLVKFMGGPGRTPCYGIASPVIPISAPTQQQY